MNTTYYPILKALTAEFIALEETKPNDANQLIPIFEIPKVPGRKKYEKSPTPKAIFIEDTSEEIRKIWTGRHAMFDTFQWNPAETVENGEHVIPYTYNTLNSMGVYAVPVVGYDRWTEQDYRHALIDISRRHQGKFCIRLDHTAFEDSADPVFFRDTLEDILLVLEIDPFNCHIVLDFEDITQFIENELFSKFESMFNLVYLYDFMSYSVAGCSLPNTIDKAVKEPNSSGLVQRKEMQLWKSVRQHFPRLPVYFGDYGVRGPNTNVGVPSKHTNGKIRYTIDKEYFIARGHSISVYPKGEQMWKLAQTIIDSGHYLGPRFSWGDSEILRCSKMEFKGNAGKWIAVDTNHHLAYVVAEITEFEHATTAHVVSV